MGMYKYIKEAWKKPKSFQNYKKYLYVWRRQPSIVRVDKPTRLDRARKLGYRAKQGVVVARVKVIRGGRKRKKFTAGRRPKRYSRRKDLDLNYQNICERRASRKYDNCEVLNSYWVGKDKRHYYYEVILLDRDHPVIKNDDHYSKIIKQKDRAERGVTSSGKKSRGLRSKGVGAEKVRPSRSQTFKRKMRKKN
ncbi:MAG: 50S ribosomal protein L15e [Candidatus Woesearchaeota archaeon]